jgi:hypothetical protein
VPEWCPSCNAMLPEGLEECPRCGAPLGKSQSVEDPVIARRTVVWFSLGFLGVAIAIILVGLIIGSLCLFVFLGR